ncbi:MAG: hypothetical protein ABIL58_23610 [Pseudomonadota bacterium]
MDNKKKVAAISAVIQYIRTEEEALLMQAMAAPGPAAEAPVSLPAVAANAWGMSGRQSIMQVRTLMQMRAFHGARLR